jgi:hypothetical protein
VEMAQWASSMALIALVTCTAETLAQSPPVQRAPPVVPEMPQDTWRQGPPPDMRGASRRFTRAVQRFAIAVRRLETSATAPSDRDVAYAIERFARALESAPYAEDVRVSSAVADMRAALREARLAGPPGSPRARQALADALFIGEEVLLDLAYGPYQESREVTSRAWELENTLDGLLDEYTPNDPRRFVLVLRQSVSVMNAMAQLRG